MDVRMPVYFLCTLIAFLALGFYTRGWAQHAEGMAPEEYTFFLYLVPATRGNIRAYILLSIIASYLTARTLTRRLRPAGGGVSLRESLKPTVHNVALALLLFAFTSLAFHTNPFKAPLYGFPLGFYYAGHDPSSTFCQLPPCPRPWLNPANLAADLVFWYAATALAAWAYRRM